MSAVAASLRLSELSYLVHLGCSPEERAARQEIRVSFVIGWAAPPAACKSDRIEETLCYGQLSQAIRSFLSEHSFATIEALGYGLFNALKARVGGARRFRLEICKVKPPIAELLGGATFTLEETL